MMPPNDAITLYVDQQENVDQYCVAYSGGVDSHLLLVLMARLRDARRTFSLRAVHVNHGLQADSDKWAVHARQICHELRVPLEVCECTIEQGAKGPEAAARSARYEEFARLLYPDEHLLLGQHAEDQAETFLLQALRGSGPDGLAAIPGKRVFSHGKMARPFLGCTKQAILETAQALNLKWVEDPSNQQDKFDRNFLRLHVMPIIKSRWPAATQTLSRAAMRSAAASQALISMAHQDLNAVKVPGKPELRLSALKKLPTERSYTAIRLWVRLRGLPMPRLQDLKQVQDNLIDARHDSHGVVNVRQYEFRRYLDSLYLLEPQVSIPAYRYVWQAPFADLFIAETGTTLTLSECFRQGIRMPEDGPVIVKSRAGGELIALGNPVYHKAVKKILQESSIPPWQRAGIPLLYINDTLAAVWQLVVSVGYQSKTLVRRVAARPSRPMLPASSVKPHKAESSEDYKMQATDADSGDF